VNGDKIDTRSLNYEMMDSLYMHLNTDTTTVHIYETHANLIKISI
jgi:uncharacterized protein YdaL